MATKPFAVEIARQARKGMTVAQIAAQHGIPEDRIRMRIRAGEEYLHRHTISRTKRQK